ncbi:amidase [Kribbella turkmenica]|uniref:Amidase n=1 Tax=Kribbella turkmenica TaxID=2530375 RepID=A0A4R4WH35_9ACTN|nr:amidase family protein [Kribbella turkmenica]TDD18339.1 amidase [Kribbella turkmenica]
MNATATEIAARIRAGQVSSREVTERMLARIAADTDVNAVVETRPEFALKAAADADEAVTAGRELGPLHGVPMTVKESFNVAGLHTTWGEPAFAEYVADWDATVVERLSRAGAIIVGKSNVHTMLGDFGQTTNEIYGRTNNPADLTRTPGGSSGGGAAALAAGLTYLEYGSDLVGSIRLPAAYCGVYGLKPTNGLVPLRGVQPPGPPAPPTELPMLSTIGPLARSAADLRTALAVTGGPAAPYSWRLQQARHDRLADFRVGVVLDHADAPVSGEVGTALSETVDRLDRSGAKVVEGWPPGVDASEQADAFGFQVGLFLALQGEAADFAGLAEVVAQERRRMAQRMIWQRYFEEVDVFLCPTSFTTAFPHDDRTFDDRTITTSYGEQRYDAQVFWIAHASLTGLPALSMPIGSAPAGLPVAAQVIGPWHEDDTPITFAELLAAELE